MTRSATRTKWARHVQRWRASGQTARDFCDGAALNRQTLLWWSSKLGREELVAAPRGFVEVVAVAPRADGVIEIVVPEQVRIRVSGAFDAAMLRRVVTALEGR
jgi:hypothetical protein